MQVECGRVGFRAGTRLGKRESRRRQRRSSRRPMLQNLRRVSARENACLRRATATATATATAAAVRNAAGNQKPVAETRMTMQREEEPGYGEETDVRPSACQIWAHPTLQRRRQGIPSKQKSTAAAKHKPRPARHPSRSETSLPLLFFALTIAILRSTFAALLLLRTRGAITKHFPQPLQLAGYLYVSTCPSPFSAVSVSRTPHSRSKICLAPRFVCTGAKPSGG